MPLFTVEEREALGIPGMIFALITGYFTLCIVFPFLLLFGPETSKD